METSGFFSLFILNYLAHHFLYAEDQTLFNVGLILPDLSRRATGRRKVSLLEPSADPDWNLLQAGCEMHYEADAWFHDCHYFQRVSETMDKWFTEKKNAGLFLEQRSWFLGHILAEMVLDRLIIDANPDALDHFYSDLKSADLTKICRYLKASGKIDTTPFEQMYKGFTESEFIRYYRDDAGLVESLSRLVQRTKQNGLSEEEKGHLTAQMPEWIELAYKTEKPHQMARLSEIL